MSDLISIIGEKKTVLTFDNKALAGAESSDKLYQKCLTIQDFVKTLEPKVKDYGKQCAKLKTDNHPLSEKVNTKHETLTDEWKSCLQFSISQLELVTRHEDHMKSMKVIKEQRSTLQAILDRYFFFFFFFFFF